MSEEADAEDTVQLLRGGNDPWPATGSLGFHHEDTFTGLGKFWNACHVGVKGRSRRLILSYISRVGVEPRRIVAAFPDCAITKKKVRLIPRFPRSL